MKTCVVTGANRGIGFEFSRQFAAAGWRVYAGCRNPDSADDLNKLVARAAIEPIALDVTSLSSIDALASRLAGEPVDLLINNAGLFGPKAGADNDLRQQFGHIDYDIWNELLRVNAMGPVRMTEALLPNLEIGREKKVATISSAISSIGDTDTGLYAYRTSKAAVNMAMATLANDLRPRGIAVGIFCPGWVRTEMGGPDAVVEPEASVEGLRARISELSLETSGSFVRYNGDALPW